MKENEVIKINRNYNFALRIYPKSIVIETPLGTWFVEEKSLQLLLYHHTKNASNNYYHHKGKQFNDIKTIFKYIKNHDINCSNNNQYKTKMCNLFNQIENERKNIMSKNTIDFV